MSLRLVSQITKKDFQMELDHPCKETCSGWKQGYEKGLLGEVKPNCSEVHKTDTELITTLHKRVKELTEALEVSSYIMRGMRSLLDLEISRDKFIYIELGKGTEIVRKALGET